MIDKGEETRGGVPITYDKEYIGNISVRKLPFSGVTTHVMSLALTGDNSL